MGYWRDHMQRYSAVILAVSVLGACAAAPERTAAANESVDLTGEWVINDELSDTPSEILGSGTAGTGAMTGLLKRFGFGVSVYGISVGDVASMLPDNSEVEQPIDFPREVTDPMDELRVVHDIDTLEVDYDATGTIVYLNGEAVSNEDQQFFAHWNGSEFMVERQPADGVSFSEKFELADDGKQLIWTVSLETPDGEELTISRVYDPKSTPETVGASHAANFVARR
jgi:hypothetical protein